METCSENTAPPKVTIGLPVYNGEAFVNRAIESLLDQTFSDFELLISDNASTDGTAEICQLYAEKDERIVYRCNEMNLGAAPNFNGLVELARGKYFKWAAHDDVCVSRFLEECVHVLDSQPEVVLSYSIAGQIDADGNPLPGLSVHHAGTRPHERMKTFLHPATSCHPVFGLTRTDILRTTPCIDSYPGSDRVLLAELSLHGLLVEIPEELFFRRFHPDQSIQRNRTARERSVWFDSLRKRPVYYPQWRRVREYAAAISRAPLSSSEKNHCRLALMGWMPTQWKPLSLEVVHGTRSVLSRRANEKNALERDRHQE